MEDTLKAGTELFPQSKGLGHANPLQRKKTKVTSLSRQPVATKLDCGGHRPSTKPRSCLPADSAPCFAGDTLPEHCQGRDHCAILGGPAGRALPGAGSREGGESFRGLEKGEAQDYSGRPGNAQIRKRRRRRVPMNVRNVLVSFSAGVGGPGRRSWMETRPTHGVCRAQDVDFPWVQDGSWGEMAPNLGESLGAGSGVT